MSKAIWAVELVNDFAERIKLPTGEAQISIAIEANLVKS
ncbi:hypothetical protein V12B01_14666 [Vibrio splendidus 12B01]|nr:hypothetical protein V12B01_14666 [Vibrio splendidus 12B01]